VPRTVREFHIVWSVTMQINTNRVDSSRPCWFQPLQFVILLMINSSLQWSSLQLCLARCFVFCGGITAGYDVVMVNVLWFHDVLPVTKCPRPNWRVAITVSDHQHAATLWCNGQGHASQIAPSLSQDLPPGTYFQYISGTSTRTLYFATS